jgi:hypothetical protein
MSTTIPAKRMQLSGVAPKQYAAIFSDGHAPDEVWERASASFQENELGALVFAITTINGWNRILITARVEPGALLRRAVSRAGERDGGTLARHVL